MLNLEIIGEGATTKIYRDGNKAVKLYVNALAGEAQNEADRQSFAYNAGLPVPAVFGIEKLNEIETALYMEYIQGRTLIHAGMDRESRNNAIRILAKLQCMVHSVDGAGMPKQKDRLIWKIEHNRYLDTQVKERLLDTVHRLDSGRTNLCHGDFHPLNILYDGEKHWIIDWVDTTSGDALADACRTYLIFKQHLSRSSGIYLTSFCKEAKVKKEDILAWLPVIAAARLSENLKEKERSMLLGIVNDRIK